MTYLGDRSFVNCGPKLWNALPVDLRIIPSIHSFKKRLKHYLFLNSHNYVMKLTVK